MIDNCCAKQKCFENRHYTGVRKTAKLAFFLFNFFNVPSSLVGFLPKLTGQLMNHLIQEK